MAYAKQTWTDDVSPMSAARWSHIEDGIEAAHAITHRVACRDIDGNIVYETSTYAVNDVAVVSGTSQPTLQVAKTLTIDVTGIDALIFDFEVMITASSNQRACFRVKETSTNTYSEAMLNTGTYINCAVANNYYWGTYCEMSLMGLGLSGNQTFDIQLMFNTPDWASGTQTVPWTVRTVRAKKQKDLYV